MKAKFLTLTFLILIVILTGCDDKDENKNDDNNDDTEIVEPHTHTYSDILQFDENYHWYPSTCGHDDTIIKIKHQIEYEIIDEIKYHKCATCHYGYQEEKLSITINYKYYDGELIETVNQKLFKGDEYCLTSPKINYMIPDKEVVEGKLQENTTIDVTYDYSYEGINPSKEIQSIKLINENGVSISFIASGILDKNEVLFYGDTFEIGASLLTLRNSIEVNLYNASWDASSSTVAPKGNKFSPYSQLDDERLITFNFTTAKNIEVYVNGMLQYVYFSNVMNDTLTAKYNNYDYKLVSEVVDEVLNEISTKGFKFAKTKSKIRNIMIGKPFDQREALNLYKQFIQVVVKHVNEDNQNIAIPTKLLGRIGDRYATNHKNVTGFKVNEHHINGEFTENKEYTISYKTIGNENLSSGPNEINKPNSLDWGNRNQWFYFARELKGDYTVVASYTLWANQFDKNGDYSSWKTALLIHFDEYNGDRWVSRFDSYGWRDDLDGDGNKIGANSNYGSMYNENSTKELQELCKGCNVVVVFTRRDQILNMTSIITPIEENQNNEVYYWNCSLENVDRESIGLAISCEFASVKITSIKY